MLKKILIVIGVLIAGVCLYAGFVMPADFRVERSVLISASPEKIFPYVNSPRKMEEWNPFSKQDPSIQVTFAGPEEGIGASSSWVSEKVGTGSATITESLPNNLVRERLDFLKPFEGTNIAEFTLLVEGEQTKVTWAMSGHSSFIQRVICVFMSMDKMVGDEFEKGLQALKAHLEKPAAP